MFIFGKFNPYSIGYDLRTFLQEMDFYKTPNNENNENDRILKYIYIIYQQEANSNISRELFFITTLYFLNIIILCQLVITHRPP